MLAGALLKIKRNFKVPCSKSASAIANNPLSVRLCVFLSQSSIFRTIIAKYLIFSQSLYY